MKKIDTKTFRANLAKFATAAENGEKIYICRPKGQILKLEKCSEKIEDYIKVVSTRDFREKMSQYLDEAHLIGIVLKRPSGQLLLITNVPSYSPLYISLIQVEGEKATAKTTAEKPKRRNFFKKLLFNLKAYLK